MSGQSEAVCLEPRESRQSHGLLDEARPPLCDGPEIAFTFGKRPHTPVVFGQFVVTQILSAKCEIHLQELQGWT